MSSTNTPTVPDSEDAHDLGFGRGWKFGYDTGKDYGLTIGNQNGYRQGYHAGFEEAFRQARELRAAQAKVLPANPTPDTDTMLEQLDADLIEQKATKH